MASNTTYTLDQVLKHNTKTDVWVIIHNKVYDITKYLEDHPGGGAVLLEVAGKDATEEFEEIGHSDEARELLEPLLVGELATEDQADAIEIYRPTFEKVSGKSDVDVRQNKKKSVWGLGITLGVVAGIGYGAFSYGSRLNVQAVREVIEHWMKEPRSPAHISSNISFWAGVGMASIVQLGLTGSLAVWVSTKLDVHESFVSFKPHRPIRPASIRLKLPSPAKQSVAIAGTIKPLDPQKWRKFKLARKDCIAPNVYKLVFSLPHANDILGLPTGQHIALRTTLNDKNVSRSYTPISNNTDLGRVELLIKVYENGAMTKHLEKMSVGEDIDIRGPKGAMKYHADLASHIGMIAGGTGITPMYQVIRASLEDPTDRTRITLLYASNTEADILLRKELDNYAASFPKRFRVQYVLSQPDPTWKGDKGFVNADMIRKSFPGPEKENKVFLCGPPPMINAMKTNLAALEYQPPGLMSKATDQVFLF